MQGTQPDRTGKMPLPVRALSPFLLLVLLALNTCRQEPAAALERDPQAGRHLLFNGKDLEGWTVTDFGGQGDVRVEEGALVLNWGNDLTGITWAGPDLPRDNYEISLEARRLQGNDFFCALTFPVRDQHCTLVLGGWGGPVVGLSSIDGRDASENETTRFMNFVKGRWYAVRLGVASGRIQAWIDGELVVDLPTEGRRLDVRAEVRLSRPLGIATWRTTGAVRSITYRLVERAGREELPPADFSPDVRSAALLPVRTPVPRWYR